MATLASSYPQNFCSHHNYNHYQPQYYPSLPSFSALQPAPNNYYTPQQPIQQQQQQQQPVQYVDSGMQYLRPRRQPRIYREVIRLPTPEPIYRQVRHRMATPERQVIQRTITHQANGNVFVQQQRPSKRRSQSRSDMSMQTRPSYSRQVYTD